MFILDWIHAYESQWLFLFLFLGLLIELHSNYVLRLEYKYDKDKDDQKKQKKTRTTKKTTTNKDGQTVTEEATETSEPINMDYISQPEDSTTFNPKHQIQFCKHKNTWFDRTLDETGSMHTRCSDCGVSLD